MEGNERLILTIALKEYKQMMPKGAETLPLRRAKPGQGKANKSHKRLDGLDQPRERRVFSVRVSCGGGYRIMPHRSKDQ